MPQTAASTLTTYRSSSAFGTPLGHGTPAGAAFGKAYAENPSGGEPKS